MSWLHQHVPLGVPEYHLQAPEASSVGLDDFVYGEHQLL